MELDELREDCARRQKKGLHFIVASVVIWGLILVVYLTGLTIEQKNLVTFCCSAVLFPLSWGLSKALGIDFEGKGNPLTKAGILFSVNQLLYVRDDAGEVFRRIRALYFDQSRYVCCQ